MDVDGIRRDYLRAGLRRADLDPDPLLQFSRWLQDALAAGLREPTAMTLATVDGDGRPSARVVLLKGYGPQGFVFYTNYRSRKALDLEANPRAALVFYWDGLERQLRVEGSASRLERDASLAYFRTRPRGSQLGAWASPQSSVVSGREELERLFGVAQARFEGGEVPLPEHWGGYLVRPEALELWQGRTNRLHDRFRYTRQGDGWLLQRLAP